MGWMRYSNTMRIFVARLREHRFVGRFSTAAYIYDVCSATIKRAAEEVYM